MAVSELVSILIPAYNAERYLADTLRSALGQTWPNKEIIVVDDGSTDGTLALARRFESPFVKVMSQPNQGPCVARNTALRQAQGDYIQWLDADDLLAPDKIRTQLERGGGGAASRVLLAAACGTFYRNPAQARFEPTSVWQDLSPRDFLVRKFTDNAHIVVHAWLVSRTLAESAGPWDVRLQRTDADGEYSCRLVAASEGVRFVPEARCHYRKGLAGSLSATRTDMEEEALLLRRLFGHLLALEDSDATREACLAWLRLWAGEFYLKSPRTGEVVAAMAESLGRPAVAVPVSRKFRLAERALGWKAARVLQAGVARTRMWIDKYREALPNAP
jgi:glycosyltransferase involved in cell wall biosynthesis